MTIKIAQRIKPFSHVPGVSCVIPGTLSLLQAYPTLLKIDRHSIPLPLTGPVRGFTVEQDLEHHCVFVFGRAKEGYFRLRIRGRDSGFEVESQKGPLKSIDLSQEIPFVASAPIERLSLGSHKTQNWDEVQKRFDLKEILPVFFCLGQKIPRVLPQAVTGTARLLEFPEERSQLLAALELFFKASFSKMLVPRLTDDEHQGLVPDEPVSGNPFFLIQEGFQKVRALFFKQNERRLSFLPHLPVAFDAGRLIGLQAPGIGEIDLEWSKKLLRRVLIRPTASGEVILELQKEIQAFRVARRKNQKKAEPLLLEAGKPLLLDQFKK